MRVFAFCFFLLFFIFSVAAPYYSGAHYALSVYYWESNGSVSFVSLFLVEGTGGDRFEGDKRFNASLYAFNGSLLHSVLFDVSTSFSGAADPSWFDEEGNQIFIPTARGIELEGHGETSIVIPFFDEGQKVVITRSSTNEVLLEVDLSERATCNQNDVCDFLEGENSKGCPFDCTDPSQDVTFVPTDKKEQNLGVVLFLVIILVVVVLAFFFKKRKSS